MLEYLLGMYPVSVLASSSSSLSSSSSISRIVDSSCEALIQYEGGAMDGVPYSGRYSELDASGGVRRKVVDGILGRAAVWRTRSSCSGEWRAVMHRGKGGRVW